MRVKNIRLISTPEEIKKKIPINENNQLKIEKHREEIKDIIEGKDNRKLIIVGPCSAWPKEAVIDFAKRIKSLQEKNYDKYKFVIRVYTQKPRTVVGWTGPTNQPDPLNKPNIEEGIKYCRDMMLKITQLNLPIADEALFTHSQGYLDDLISWYAIGARSSEDQEHRVYASMIDFPVGIKNPTSGDIKIGVNSVIAAQNPHTFLLNREEITTSGNPYSHLILRGGNKKSNISYDNLIYASNLVEENIANSSIIIDLSHDNSIDEKGIKNYEMQSFNLKQNLKLLNKDEYLNKFIKGFMIESFLKSGKQDITNNIDKSGLSITDGCLGVETIEEIFQNID